MHAAAYDRDRVILLSLHMGGPLSDADVDRILAVMRRGILDAARQGDVTTTNLVIVDCAHAPTAVHRRRMGEVSVQVGKSNTAFVMRSPLLRGIATALGWWNQGDRDKVQSTHATYEHAREWLVARSGHPASVFDAMERAARADLQHLARADV